MSLDLLASVSGLAVLDAFNPATIGLVALLLVSKVRRPIACALGVALGAALTVFALGAVLFVVADSAAEQLADGLAWLRRGAFGLATVLLLIAAARRLRARHRKAVRLPAWFDMWTALPLGAFVTAVDLPNAIPYFVAIERLVGADVERSTGLLILAGYACVYVLPCLLLVAVRVIWSERIEDRLTILYARFGTEGVQRRSLPTAALLSGLAAACAGFAASA